MSWLLVALVLVLPVLLIASLVGLHVLAMRERRRAAELLREAAELQRAHVNVRLLDGDDWGIGGWQE